MELTSGYISDHRYKPTACRRLWLDHRENASSAHISPDISTDSISDSYAEADSVANDLGAHRWTPTSSPTPLPTTPHSH